MKVSNFRVISKPREIAVIFIFITPRKADFFYITLVKVEKLIKKENAMSAPGGKINIPTCF